MGSGAAGVQRIDGDDLRWPRRGTATWAAMQGVRGLVAWWRGRGGRGGASGLVGGAREGRWLQLRRTASAAALCFGRGGEGGEAGREGRGARESEGGQGSKAMPRRLRGASVRQARREVAWRARRCRGVPPLPTGTRRKATGGGAWWAGPHRWAASTGAGPVAGAT